MPATCEQGHCEDRAVYRVTYHNGSIRDLSTLTCARHLASAEGRVFPGLDAVTGI